MRSVAALRLSNVPFRESFRFPAKPTDFVIARRAFSMPDAAILNGTKRHPGTRHGKSCAMSPCDKSKFRDYVVLCPRASFRDAIPMALRLPRRYAPRNDTESGAFLFGNGCFALYAGIFAWYCFASSFERCVSKVVPFSSKTYRFCHCEEGIFNARRGNLKRNETASRNELRGRERKRPLAASR